MVYILSSVTKVVIVSLFVAGSVRSQDLSTQQYYRPTGDEVSGFVNATTPYVRSPCPVLNTLANHGFLPNSGYNITRAHFKGTIMEVFNLGNSVATVLTYELPERLNLNYLGTHNFIEHDASLARMDASYGNDPSKVSVELLEDMISRAKDGVLTLEDVANTRKDRELSCKKKPAKCDYTLWQSRIGLGQAGLLLNVLGRNEQVPVEHVKSFFLNERFPLDWVRPAEKITQKHQMPTVLKIQSLLTF